MPFLSTWCKLHRFLSRNLHALTELCQRTGPVLVPPETKPSLYFSYIPVQLLGQPLQLPRVWTLKRTGQRSCTVTCFSYPARVSETTVPLYNSATIHKVFTYPLVYSNAGTSLLYCEEDSLMILKHKHKPYVPLWTYTPSPGQHWAELADSLLPESEVCGHRAWPPAYIHTDGGKKQGGGREG